MPQCNLLVLVKVLLLKLRESAHLLSLGLSCDCERVYFGIILSDLGAHLRLNVLKALEIRLNLTQFNLQFDDLGGFIFESFQQSVFPGLADLVL